MSPTCPISLILQFAKAVQRHNVCRWIKLLLAEVMIDMTDILSNLKGDRKAIGF
jgi:hypothetical protein